MATSPSLLTEHRAALTSYIRDNAGMEPVDLTTDTIDEVLARRLPTVKEKLDTLLRELTVRARFQVSKFWLSPTENEAEANSLMRAAGIASWGELRSLLNHLGERGLIDYQLSSSGIRLHTTIPGIVYVEDQAQGTTDSLTCFVAMWFDATMNEAYRSGIAPAIESNGFSPVRIDRENYNHKVDDEIIAAIRRARFLVADFSCGESGARGGVYFEAGFALALDRQVIFTVREDDLPRVHFDTRQFNHIVWQEPADLFTKLSNRIGATIARS